MFDLQKSKGRPSAIFIKFKMSLEQEADVKGSSGGQQIFIVCKDVDEVTTKKQIRKALEKEFNLIGFEGSAVKPSWKVYLGTITAIFSLSVEQSVGMSKNRLGYVLSYEAGGTETIVREIKKRTEIPEMPKKNSIYQTLNFFLLF